MKKLISYLKKNAWRFFSGGILGIIFFQYGMSIWETILIVFIIAIIVESIIYFKTKKKK
tara:strand:- start:520 stop:696 length:177 start_codon:yes stop_codon:yes gene_type:complete